MFRPIAEAARKESSINKIKPPQDVIRKVEAEADRLIALGWLNSESRRDPYAVTVALIKFGTQALWPDQ